jgi:hypothetical protein
MPWSASFDAPIILSNGKKLVTLRDAIKHLGETVPERERNHPKILTAATVLTDAAEDRDFLMHARIAVLRALNRHGAKPEPAPPQRKSAKAYRIVR